jgi:hypothetical protein
LLWFASGFVMSLLPIERVRGEHLVDVKSTEVISADAGIIAPASLLDGVDKPVRSLTIRPLLGRPVAELELADGTRSLRDAASGSRVTIGAPQAESIARSAYHGHGRPAAARRIHETSTEYRGALPAWRIEFDDADRTRVYIASDTGRITAVRTGTWRFYDFLWGLHIMDWKNHEDFNTPWLTGFAGAALILSVAGAVLLFMRWPGRKRRKRSLQQGTD